MSQLRKKAKRKKKVTFISNGFFCAHLERYKVGDSMVWYGGESGIGRSSYARILGLCWWSYILFLYFKKIKKIIFLNLIFF